MRINTNVASLNAQEASTNTNKTLNSSLEKLSSGLRINKAADDASGLAIADKLRTQASSLNQGISNANSASALIQIADKAMSEQSNILDVVKQKLIQASTSTTSADGREAIRKDVTKLLEQFDNIATQTNYNGTTLLQQSADNNAKQADFSFQLGENSSFDVALSQTHASNTSNLGGGAETLTSADNIGQGESMSFKTATGGTIVLSSVDLDAAGDDTNGTLSLDLAVNGIMGKVTASVAMVLDLNSSSQSIRDQVENLAVSNTNLTDNGDGTFGLATAEIDFGSINFSGANLKATTAATKVTFETDAEIQITNNNTTSNSGGIDHGHINYVLDTATTGGSLLRDLAQLGEGELTADKANSFMSTIDQALSQVNTTRSDFGSSQNQVESSIRNMQTTATNLKAAESVIRDVDYAQESANFNKQNIIAQAGTYAMSQANSMAQNVQRLLQ